MTVCVALERSAHWLRVLAHPRTTHAQDAGACSKRRQRAICARCHRQTSSPPLSDCNLPSTHNHGPRSKYHVPWLCDGIAASLAMHWLNDLHAGMQPAHYVCVTYAHFGQWTARCMLLAAVCICRGRVRGARRRCGRLAGSVGDGGERTVL